MTHTIDRRTALAGLAALMALSTRGAHARRARGVYMRIEQVQPNPVTRKPLTATFDTWQDGARFRRDDPISGRHLVVDADAGVAMGISPRTKTYWSIEAAAFQALLRPSLVALGMQFDAAGNPLVRDPLFVRTGKTGEIAGRKAFEVTPAGGAGHTHIWVSKDVPLTPGEIAANMRASLGAPKGPAYDALFAQWRALGGYPVQSSTVGRGPSGVEVNAETVLDIKRAAVDPTLFQKPAGFRRIADPLHRMQRSEGPPVPGIGAPLKP